MKASDKFKRVIENYLTQTALGDTAFAQNFCKSSKNLESCYNYIFGEVKKTGLCAFDNQEIFDMAVKYYTDDSIEVPAPVNCKAIVGPPAETDLFTSAPPVSETRAEKKEAVQVSKPIQKTLTLFDL